ncbi:MAG: OmpA family protein [Myxococcota bacterium]
MGNDVDPSLHFGGGLKAYLTRRAQVRIDVRDVIGHKRGVENGFRNHSFEALLGVSLTLGREKREEQSACNMKDSDGDGFLDINDRCVDEFGEAPYGCPVLDSDGDGFLDNEDRCIDEPGGMPSGCPIRDKDGDGVLDSADRCIEQPESANGFEDEDGCPDELPEELAELDGVMEGIRFQTAKALILPRSRPRLDRAIDVMKRFPGVRVEISGHTDNRGPHDYNVGLSQRRADAVRNYLVTRGIDASRLQTRGVGPNEPVASNNTKRGRARNRRIEFHVITTKDGK